MCHPSKRLAFQCHFWNQMGRLISVPGSRMSSETRFGLPGSKSSLPPFLGEQSMGEKQRRKRRGTRSTKGVSRWLLPWEGRSSARKRLYSALSRCSCQLCDCVLLMRLRTGTALTSVKGASFFHSCMRSARREALAGGWRGHAQQRLSARWVHPEAGRHTRSGNSASLLPSTRKSATR